MKRISELFMIICFLGFLAAGLVATVLREPATVSYFENRTLAAFPQPSGESVGNGSFSTQIERYLEDHAALRTTILQSKVRLDMALRRPVVNNIVITPGPLLPYLAVGAGTADTATVEGWARNMADGLSRINDTVAEYGGYYCYVAVPCQYAYFEDDYPWYLENRSAFSHDVVSSLERAMAERNVPFLDIRAAFDAMGHPDEYSSLVDNHYTMAGAFETYRLVMEKITAETGLDFPILESKDVIFEPLPNDYFGSRERRLMGMVSRDEHPSILRPVTEIPFSRSNGGIPGASEVYALGNSNSQPLSYMLYMGGDIANTVIDTHRDELPSILIYGDSFTNALECVAYLSFDEMHSLDLRHYRAMSLEDYIRELQPEIVICIRDYEVLLSPYGNGATA